MWRVAIITSLALLLPSSAMAQQASASERAYALALTCSVVAGYFDDRDGAVKSGEAVTRMAKVLGYSTSRQAADSITMANVLGVELRSDPTIMAQHREACRRYRLAS